MRKLLHLHLFCLAVGAAAIAAAPTAPDILPWRRYEPPQFPASLLSTPVRDGFALIAFTFDDDGRITDRVTLAASHPAFAVAVFEAAESWQIDTSRLSDSVIRREMIRYEFQRGGALVSLTQREAIKLMFSPYIDEPKMAVQTFAERDLDPPLRVLSSAVPEFPPGLKARGIHGTATVNFIVDAEGRVRIPAVTHATDPEFGEAVVTAVRQWRFAPPQHGTLPVQVSVDRAFNFGGREPGG